MASETMTRDDIYREFAKGEDADGLYHVQMDEMADEIIRLRTTAGTGAELSYGYDDDGEDCSDAWYELTTMAASTRPDSDYVVREWKLTFGQVRRYVEELRTRKAQKATGAGGGRVTDDLRELLAACDALAQTDAMGDDIFVDEPEVQRVLAAYYLYFQRAALAPQGVTDAMVEAALMSWFSVRDVSLSAKSFTVQQRLDVRAMLTAALAASARGDQ